MLNGCRRGYKIRRRLPSIILPAVAIQSRDHWRPIVSATTRGQGAHRGVLVIGRRHGLARQLVVDWLLAWRCRRVAMQLVYLLRRPVHLGIRPDLCVLAVQLLSVLARHRNLGGRIRCRPRVRVMHRPLENRVVDLWVRGGVRGLLPLAQDKEGGDSRDQYEQHRPDDDARDGAAAETGASRRAARGITRGRAVRAVVGRVFGRYGDDVFFGALVPRTRRDVEDAALVVGRKIAITMVSFNGSRWFRVGRKARLTLLEGTPDPECTASRWRLASGESSSWCCPPGDIPQ